MPITNDGKSLVIKSALNDRHEPFISLHHDRQCDPKITSNPKPWSMITNSKMVVMVLSRKEMVTDNHVVLSVLST